ncbi:diacylglycerol kinase [Thalassovita sp.]|jgi:diacylglycerol kinase (ATP)|uniref:diacylglycerol kinase n=1 Tax=Thalassovita sp. TaxID=1979401 RepID=UPI0029DE516C|nr:diacylglycerol kinase [Thalassovita sp.]
MLYFLKRLRLRVIWSWAGCADVWRTEHSFRSWVWANLVSALAALILPLDTAERALILALGVLVLAFELINSAIERVVDDVGKEQRELAKQAKDAGSAGVAVAAIAAGLAWVVILIGLI